MKKINILLFTQTMASLLKSSLSLQDALAVCSEIIKEKKLKSFCLVLEKSIREGNFLSSAVKKFDNVFSPMYLALLKIGEESGTLTEVFQKLASYLKEKKEMKNKIIQSLIYPILVLITAIAVVFVILFFVFPRLEVIFLSFTENSTEIKENVEKIKYSLSILLFLICFLVLIIMVCVYVHKKNGKGAAIIDNILLKLPFIGKFILTNQTNDFTFAMKLLCSSYFPFVESLKLASLVVKNIHYKNSILSVHRKIEQGYEIGKAFEEEKIFPSYFVTWIRIAEKNGDTDGVFNQIHEYYTNESESIITAITVSIEPFFILTTGIIIFILIGLFVIPIFKLLGGL